MFLIDVAATTPIYTLSLHDALPILPWYFRTLQSWIATFERAGYAVVETREQVHPETAAPLSLDRKSTRLNSSHSQISYAVFCLKKKTTMLLKRLPRFSPDYAPAGLL